MSVPWWHPHIVTMVTRPLLSPGTSCPVETPEVPLTAHYDILSAGDQSFPCVTLLHFLWEVSSIVPCPPHHRLVSPPFMACWRPKNTSETTDSISIPVGKLKKGAETLNLHKPRFCAPHTRCLELEVYFVFVFKVYSFMILCIWSFVPMYICTPEDGIRWL